jgi:hypothetical protein
MAVPAIGEVGVRFTNRRSARVVLVLALGIVPFSTMFATASPNLATDAALAAPGHAAKPSKAPRSTASPGPSSVPTPSPTAGPTFTMVPSTAPSPSPTPAPTIGPSFTVSPTWFPTNPPTNPPTPSPTASPSQTANPTPCTAFPSDNVWNRDISTLPVRSDSAALVGSIGLSAYLHPDFSATGYGIPINKVNLTTPRYPVTFAYADESDAGPYPIPASPKIEGGSDRHLILWDTEGCGLYEIYDAVLSGGQWTGGSGAIWDLRSNALRPAGWTSADAAGLPILPGLVRYDEVAAGAILHALRFTAPSTARAYIYPARHQAGCSASNCLAPMGLRVRLKASVDISGFGPQARVILAALKRYGMLLADNGSPWYVTGAPDARWNDDDLHALQTLHGSDFEAVDTSALR